MGGVSVAVATLQYYAALFDGDGCVDSDRASPRVRLSQYNKHIQDLHILFGGSFQSKDHRGSHTWTAQGLRAYLWAKMMHQFVWKKRRELELLISFFENEISLHEYKLEIKK